MRLVKELNTIVNYLNSIGEPTIITSPNKILFESGSIEYNKRNMNYTIKTIQGELYKVEDVEQLEELLQEI